MTKLYSPILSPTEFDRQPIDQHIQEVDELDPLERSTEFLQDSPTSPAPLSKVSTADQNLRDLIEKADILFHKISTNTSLLEKLRKDLVDAKIKYGQLQTELADAENEGDKLRKLKESESMNFGEIIEDLISIVFERTICEDGVDTKDVESLQNFGALVERISDAVEKGHNFKIEFTFMNVDDCEGGRLQASNGSEVLKPLKGDKFDKSSIQSDRVVWPQNLLHKTQRTNISRCFEKKSGDDRVHRRRRHVP